MIHIMELVSGEWRIEWPNNPFAVVSPTLEGAFVVIDWAECQVDCITDAGHAELTKLCV
tara:strand:- start:709 stop:885 length:177 start_codon:yes stop_codon:yes gene_type:complete